jgi:hypothetical protein
MITVVLLEGQIEARWSSTAESDPLQRGETIVLPAGLAVDVRMRLLPKLDKPWLSVRPVNDSDSAQLNSRFASGEIIPTIARNLAIRLDWRLRLGLNGSMPPPPGRGANDEDDGTPAYRLLTLGLDRLASHSRYMTAVGKAGEILDLAYMLTVREGAAEYEPSPVLTQGEWREWFGNGRAFPGIGDDAWLSLAQVLSDVDDAPLRLQLMQDEPRFRPQHRALFWDADELLGVGARLDAMRSAPTRVGESNTPYNVMLAQPQELAVFLGNTALEMSVQQKLAACMVAALLGYLVDGPSARAAMAQLGHDAVTEAWQMASEWVDKRAGPERL